MQLTDGIDFDDLMAEKNYSMFPVYARSKLANVMFTVELQRRIQAKNLYLAAYAVHPGLVLTEVRAISACDASRMTCYHLSV